MAGERGLSCIPHSANHCLVSVFTLHLMCAIPNAGPYMEHSIEFDAEINRMAGEMFSSLPEIKDGSLAMEPGPGWGVVINSGWLQKAEYRESAL
jgi:L-alanine-DL-glutamate epimerase-like enolase superfamily enzyme